MVMQQDSAEILDADDLPILMPAAIVQRLAPVFEVSTTRMARLLGMSRHVVWRRIHRRQALPPEYQARAMGAIRVYVIALNLYWYQTLNGRREARRWMNDWLRSPSVRFSGRRPIELLGSVSGQRKLLAVLTRIETGDYM